MSATYGLANVTILLQKILVVEDSQAAVLEMWTVRGSGRLILVSVAGYALTTAFVIHIGMAVDTAVDNIQEVDGLRACSFAKVA